MEEMKAGSAQAKSCCVCVKPKKIMQQMHGIILKLFDCWADPFAHLFLLKSSMIYFYFPTNSQRGITALIYQGRRKKVYLSNLPALLSAGSKTSGLLVAPMTTTCPSLSSFLVLRSSMQARSCPTIRLSIPEHSH